MAVTIGTAGDGKQVVADESGDRLPAKPIVIAARADGWWVVGVDGEDVAGPFATVKDLQDFLDWRENQPKPA